jgi:hypothetical protein
MTGSDTAGQEREQTERSIPRTVGTFHFLLAAAMNTVTGGVLIYLGASKKLLRWTFSELRLFETETALLREGETIAFVTTHGAVVVGFLLLLAGIGGIVHWKDGVRRSGPSWGVPVVVFLLNPLTLPLTAVSIALLCLDRRSSPEPGD